MCVLTRCNIFSVLKKVPKLPFWGRLQINFRLCRYPEARIIRDAMPRWILDAYEKTFEGADLPATASQCVSAGGSQDRAEAVARDAGGIAARHPRPQTHRPKS